MPASLRQVPRKLGSLVAGSHPPARLPGLGEGSGQGLGRPPDLAGLRGAPALTALTDGGRTGQPTPSPVIRARAVSPKQINPATANGRYWSRSRSRAKAWAM